MTTVRLRHVAEINPPTPAFERLPADGELTFLPMESVWPDDRLDISQRRAKSTVSTGYTRFQDGDVLVPKITPTFEASRSVLIGGLHNGVGAGTTELHVLRAGPQLDPRFLLYLVHTHTFLKLGKAEMYGVAGQQRVPDEFLRNLPVPLPSVIEQRRIAELLDTETARIDNVNRHREHSISTLRERFEAEIDRVTRGGDAVDSKPAEYTPLGTIPSSWRQGRLRSVDCEVQTGPFGSQLHAEDYVEGGWPVVNPANIHPEGLVADSRVSVEDSVQVRLSRHILRQGDVVFARRGELGRAAVVTTGQEGWICGTGSLRVRFRNGAFHAGYLRRYLSIPAVRHYFQLQAVGSTMANLNSSILLGMPLLLPSIDEQQKISSRCDEIEREHWRRVRLLKRQQTLLTERRHALIAAAVSGRIDVSTASGRGVGS